MKARLKKILKTRRYRKRKFQDKMNPIFVLGINRSGTSMVSSLVSQHPALEGLFAGNSSVQVSQETGHSEGFCESNHIWDWLISDSQFGVSSIVEDYFLWGHPKHISRYYRDRVANTKEKNLLYNAIDFYRQSLRIPLIKDQFNSLRIPLIKAIFPHAKFIVVVRELENYIPSCLHKWTKNQKIQGDYPSIGLHWLSFYQTVFYDLKRFAPNDYVVMDYALLFAAPEVIHEKFNDMFAGLGLVPHHLDLSGIDKDVRFIDGDLKGVQNRFDSVDAALLVEKTLYK